MPAMEFKELE